MTLEEFRASVSESTPPPALPPLLKALWWDAKGNFDRAHEIAQDEPSPDGAWVHAYLHRKEGDAYNAGYWYRQARQRHPQVPLDHEWDEIAAAFLNRTH
jgi:hypothetical protein